MNFKSRAEVASDAVTHVPCPNSEADGEMTWPAV